MSTKNKKTTASDILMDYDKLQALLKEESKKTVAALLAESIKDGLNDAIEDDEDEKEYEIKDDDDSAENEVDNDETFDDSDAKDDDFSDEEFNDSEGDETEDEESELDDEESEGSDDEWSEFDKYKVDDDTYDLSGEKDDAAVIKVYKLLKDSDKVIVKKEGNRAEIKDAETGAEYVIDFGDENPDVEKVEDGNNEVEGGDDIDALNEGMDMSDAADIDGETWADDDNPDDVTMHEYLEAMRRGDTEFAEQIKMENPELFNDEDENENMGNVTPEEPSDEEYDNMTGADQFETDPNMDDVQEPEFNTTNEGKKSRKTMKESKEKVLFEVDLGYTDNYQSKDPIEGLSNTEPSKGKKNWDAGVPDGTSKPWAGKGDSAPFDKKVNEGEFDGEEIPVDGVNDADVEEIEENVTTSKSARRRSSKTFAPTSGDENKPEKSRHMSSSKAQYDELRESVKKLQKENKMLKEAALKIKGALQEAVLVNINLGQVLKVLQENSTTAEEKSNIIARFNKVKSIKESQALYESITRELSSTKKTITLEEKTMTVAPAKQINESTVYENPGLAEIRDMMNRIDNARI